MAHSNAALIFLSLSVSVLFGQTSVHPPSNASVEVRNVDFTRIRDRSGDEWWQATVLLHVDAGGGGARRFANRVRVGFNLAVQRPNTDRGLEFYRAAVTAASLEAGRRSFRFYLPPAIVRRDRLTSAARFWTVDLVVDGSPVPPTRDAVASGFSSVAAVENFRRQVMEEALVNDGVLLPHHLTPWAAVSNDPAVIRPEAIDGKR